MFELFFTIVFLAELIIAGWIISKLKKFDKWACDTNLKVLDVKPKICKILNKFKISVELITKGYDKAVSFITKQKSNLLSSFIKNLMTLVLIFLLKVPGKKALAFFDVLTILIKVFITQPTKKVCN